ncbi:MAG TPA: FtsX-like permease family protein [Euzebya sp.]|nr:FtsX-like permease family protein [Euzebya sp.]
MTAVSILGGLALLLLLPLVIAALRQPTLATMALRNISRRRGEAVLVVAGALLGTAIITSSFVVGDVIEGSFADTARTRYGPIDITLTSGEGADLAEVTAAVQAARIPGIDGLLATTTATATLQAPQQGTALPQVRIAELDLAAARGFGTDPRITGVAGTGALSAGEVIVNERIAQQLDVRVGDALRLHAYGDAVDVRVAQVVAEVGLAGYGGAILAPGTIASLAQGEAVTGAPPRDRLLVSLDGGVFDTRDLSDAAVASLRAAVVELPGVEVEGVKATVLDDAQRAGAGFTELFSIIGSFSVLAGILLLVNLFVMLAEERKTELGMLRAVGFTRRRLTRAFGMEGAIYALVASATGAIAGIGIGWLVAVLAGGIFGVADQGSGYPLVIEPVSLAIGASTGLVISLLTIWATSLRISRLNIIRAIRDLPEPTIARARMRTLVTGTIGVLAGAALGIAGYVGEAAIPLLLGIPVAAFAAAPLLRRLLPERLARLLVATTVLAWALAVSPLFPEIMSVDGDPALFVLQGVVMTAGAVSLAASLDRVWTFAIERLGRGGRGLAPRLGIAYPLARRFRTSMLLAMFSLVIFMVTILVAMAGTFERSTDSMVEEVAAGFDVRLDANPAHPIDAEALLSRDDVVAVAGLDHGVARFDAEHLDGARAWPITGFDADLLQRGTPVLTSRDEAFASDAAAYRAVMTDPTLAIVPPDFLALVGATTELGVGDALAVIDPASGQPRELTIAGISSGGASGVDWLGNGAFVSREVTAGLFGAQDNVARAYLAVADGADADVVATTLNAAFLEHGADAHTFTALVTDAMSQQTGLLGLLQGFLGLGLLVGTAGLGVVMVRAVRERRQEIGMLRAIGLRTGLVRAALLSEAGLIAVQGAVIGAVLGLVTTRQLLTAFGDGQMPFVVPWAGLVVVLALPLAACLAATAWPASRAAAIRPAVALRTAD